MKTFFRWTLTSSLFLVLILVSVPFLVPMDTFKPELEERLSRLMHRQVMIGSLQLQMLPSVELKAEGISMWSKDAGTGEIFVKTMHLVPDIPLLLFEGVLSISHIKLDGLATNQRFINSTIRKITRHETQDKPFTTLERISAKQVTVRANDGRMLGPYWLNLFLTADYDIKRMQVGRMDKTLKIKLSSGTGGYQVKINAADWTLPLSPALHFDQFQASGILTENRLFFSHIESHAYNGNLQGNAEITWGKRWRIAADVTAAAIQMAPIISLFKGGGFQGGFSGDLNILLTANRADQLLEDPLITGNFSIANGVVLSKDKQQQLFVFDQFKAYGKLRRHAIETQGSLLSAYNGTISGDTKTSWRPGWSFTANLKATTVDTEELLAEYYDQKIISGNLSGQALVKLTADTFSEMFATPFVEGRLQLSQGAIYKTEVKSQGKQAGKSSKLFEFEEIRSAGRLTPDALETYESEIVAYGGLIRGSSLTNWHSGWSFSANLEPQSINTERLLAEFYNEKIISGDLSGQVSVKFSGDTFSEMFATPFVEGRLQLSQGAIYKTSAKSQTRQAGGHNKLFEFDTIRSAGRLTPDALETHETEILAYGGLIRGSSLTNWHSGWSFNANLEAQSINTETLLENIVDEKLLSGDFHGRATVKLNGAALTDMFGNPDIQGDFRITDGILFKADLEKASIKLSGSGANDGQTRFNELRGETRIKDGATQIDDIKITSSVIQAAGNLSIDNTRQLHGELDVGLRKTTPLISIPLIVSGTSTEPRLRPSNSALLGGMVGTTILGPGIGTALGIKVGESMGKIVTAISKPAAVNQ